MTADRGTDLLININSLISTENYLLSRNRHARLRRDDPQWQQAMENGFPKDAQGNPVKYADPRGGWVANGNDGGLSVAGRANNCADYVWATLPLARPARTWTNPIEWSSSGT